MSDGTVFTRFLFELRTLITAIESHVVSLGVATPEERRPQALREMARLAAATAALTQAFEVEDVRVVAAALAQAASEAAETSESAPFAPLGAHDALTYMKWRAERFADHGQASPPTGHERRLAGRLERTLRGQAPETAPTDLPEATRPAEEYTFPGASELTLDELALLQSFPSARLRPRDAQADARSVARVTGAPIFTAKTESGADVPVYGGMEAASKDEIDELPPELRRVFTRESQAEVRALGKLMLEFEQRPDDAETLASMAFIAHKLKGAASTMAFYGFAQIADAFEETARARQSRRATTDSVFLAGLARFLDLFERALTAAEELEEPAPALIEEARALRDELTRGRSPGEIAHDERAADVGPWTERSASGTRRRLSDEDLVLRVEARKLDMLMNQLSALAANRGAMARNRSEITHVQEEMRATLLRLREKSAQISDTHPLTFDNLFSTRADGVSVGAIAGDGATPAVAPVASETPSGALRASWNDLEMERYTDVDSALRALAEVVADVSANYGALTGLLDRLSQLTETQEALTRDIQEDAMDMRLARMDEIMPRVRLAALVAAKNLGKLADFEVRGDDIEIDRSVLEALEDPLIQMMRNAIAHGIENPLERAEAGKPARGKVWLRTYSAGSSIVIEVGDDGRGINANLLVGAAIGAQLISAEEARDLTEEQALAYMFRPGISTSGAASGYVGALAGSGIGLADVAHTIHALKGSISVRSELTKGTTFRIRVPVSLSVQPVLEVSAGGQVFALPFAMVLATGIVLPERLSERVAEGDEAGPHEWRLVVDAPPGEARTQDEETADGDDSAVAIGVHEVPAFALAELLGFEQDRDKLRHMALVRRPGETVALLLESVGDADVREAAVRPLPRRFERRVVRGAVVRPEDGEVALLIDPQEVLAQRRFSAEVMLRPARAPVEPRAPSPTVLIVDDSVTIRRSLEQSLTAAGFSISQASDGREALEVMEKDLPAVVVLDVEMPRLSGFELLTIMRSSPQYQQVRVVMLTTRAADKHRNYALAIGADAYLVKPCPQETLIETIRRLLTASEPT